MQKRSGFVTFIMVVLVIAFAGIGLFKLVDCVTAQENTDGATKLLSRSARLTDVKITQGSNFTLGFSFDVVPLSDIDDLQVTVVFLNSSKAEVDRKVKTMGNVKKDQKYNFTFGITEFSFANMMSIEYTRYEITGGTISYFG